MDSSKRGLAVLVLVVGVSAALGGVYGRAASASSSADAGDLRSAVKAFSRAVAIIQQNYADPVDIEHAVYDGAIPGMLHALDPHSYFFDPRQWAVFNEEQEGKYYGVGMTVISRKGRTVVLSPFVNSPAFRAGIRPGDIVLNVDDKTCDGLDTDQVADLLKGPRGTRVTLSLGREGWDQPIVARIVRDEIPRPGVDFFTLAGPGVGYVRVSTFNERTDSDLVEALRQLDLSHLEGIILDFRGNGGGLLDQAVGIADMFLNKSQLIVSRRGRATEDHHYYALHGNSGSEIPLVLLINGQSASASEIVVGAMQDHDRGLVVGETSFGKGLVQSEYPLGNSTGLLLTTGRYYTPSGRLIQRAYKSVSLYDYYYNRKPPEQPEVKLTDGGRQVYGGGGITPDVVVTETALDPFESMLLRRNVFYPGPDSVGDFTTHFLGQKPDITLQFAPDDAVLGNFREYLSGQHIRYSERDIQGDAAWIKSEIRREAIICLFGLTEGYKLKLAEDQQVRKAVDLMPQARALYQNTKKILAERAMASRQAQP